MRKKLRCATIANSDMQNVFFRAIGAAGAQVPYKHKVRGSNPLSPTMNPRLSAMRVFSFGIILQGFEPREGRIAQWAIRG